MSHIWWYIARSSGLTAWTLLVASLVLGALASGRLTEKRGSLRWLLDLHPWVSGLALATVALHIAAIVADTFVKITIKQAVVPWMSPWRATAVAGGAIAFWRMLVVQVSSLTRSLMPKRYWHGIHMTSYLLAVLATLHSIQTGTDVSNKYVVLLISGGVTIAVAVSLQRAFGVGKMRREAQKQERLRIAAQREPNSTSGR